LSEDAAIPGATSGVRIGRVALDGRVSLAPLAGVTDLPFRLLCKEYGAAMLTTEMVSAEGIARGHGPTLEYARFDDRERPIAVQLYGSDAGVLAEAARIIADRLAPELIDVNFGCPVRKIVGKGAGSACLRDPERFGAILRALAEAVEIPVTAKIRSGWDAPVAPTLARIAEDAGAAALSVHGRTREQGYRGEADWNVVRECVRATDRLPIIGNGDVTSAETALLRLEKTGCAMIMIGRGAMGRPWIFRQIRSRLTGGAPCPEPTVPERIDVAMRHYGLALEHKEETVVVREMRTHLLAYLRDLPGFSSWRRELLALPRAHAVLTFLEARRDEAA